MSSPPAAQADRQFGGTFGVAPPIAFLGTASAYMRNPSKSHTRTPRVPLDPPVVSTW